MSWLMICLSWYFVFLLLGLSFFPLTKKIFDRFFPDLGYGFTKVLAILLLSYLTFVLGLLKIVFFSQTNLIFLIFLFILFNIILLKKNKFKTPLSSSPRLRTKSEDSLQPSTIVLIIFEETLFFLAFFFWAFVRGQDPSIRGLEKFMDFGFINSILRSKYFPPLDMWLAADKSNSNSFFINYYYFGHLTAAVLIKLTGIKPAVGYNLTLATVFALSIIQAFSLISGIIYTQFNLLKENALKVFHLGKIIIFGLLGSFIINLGGNLHTIYVFTKGYPNENPIPFWQILSWYNPGKYWYPNATRFIPYTIHEFPSYSWVVADLHGHVFDIPFVLLTLAILFILFLKTKTSVGKTQKFLSESKYKIQIGELKVNKLNYSTVRLFILNYLKQQQFSTNFNKSQLLTIISLGFLTAIHYMTNAFDGPIYLLLTAIFLLIIYRNRLLFFLINILILILSFAFFSFPFSKFFHPFVNGIGVNCSPPFLNQIGSLGPFLFEKDKCQISPLWMLLLLWGFFWVNFLIFLLIKLINKNKKISNTEHQISNYIFILFAFGTFLLIIPEFFYIKDIYPAHFRANTMFKMGYQAFIMMSVASTYTFFLIKSLPKKISLFLSSIFIFFFFFVAIYPLFSIPSYYGKLDRKVELDGSKWLASIYPQDDEIIKYINENISGQPTILEAQGDSYSDYERISAFTGLPTVAGWWVHEWLWRGSADVVGKRIPDIVNIYESKSLDLTRELLKKYHIRYIVVSQMERQKYPNLNEEKFLQIATLIFRTSNNIGALYKVNL